MSELDVCALSNKVAVVVVSNVATALIELAAVVTLARLLPKHDVAIIALVLVIYQTARFLAVFGLPESVFYFYERLSAGVRRAFVLQTATLLAVMGLGAGLLMVGVSLAIPWILGGWEPASRDTVAQLLPVLALVVVLELPTALAPNVLLVNDRARQSAVFSIMNGVGGFLALVLPLLLAMFMVVFLYLRRIARHLKTSMANVVPLRHYLQVFLLALVVAAGTYALRRFGLSDLSRPLAMGLAATAFAVVFTVAGRVLGLITADHWSIVRGWMRLEFITQSRR